LWLFRLLIGITSDVGWHDSPHHTKYANELLSQQEVVVGEGVTVIRMSEGLQENEFEAGPAIVTRKAVRDLWNRVLRQRRGNGVTRYSIVIGSPGIGKSRSMTYLLRMLLQEGKRVVYEVGKQDIVLLFTPDLTASGGGYTVQWKYTSEGLADVLLDADTWYLVDPSNSVKEPGQWRARTVLAASPNSGRYKEFRKAGAQVYFMSMWEERELLAAREVMCVDKPMSAHDVSLRFGDYGGIPRHVYGAFNSDYMNAMTGAVDTMPFSVVERVVVHGAGEIDARKTFAPSSAVVGYKSVEPFDSDSTTTVIVSARAGQEIIKKYSTQLASLWDTLPRDAAAFKGHLFQELAMKQLIAGGTFTMAEFAASKTGKSYSLTTTDEQFVVSPQPAKFVWLDTANVPLLDPHVTANNNSLVIPMQKNWAAVDAVGRDGAYQITFANGHDIKRAGILRAMKLFETEFGTAPTAVAPMYIYFIIAKEKYETWAAKTSTCPFAGEEPIDWPSDAEVASLIRQQY
jgi:hypothetical protein